MTTKLLILFSLVQRALFATLLNLGVVTSFLQTPTTLHIRVLVGAWTGALIPPVLTAIALNLRRPSSEKFARRFFWSCVVWYASNPLFNPQSPFSLTP